jgi:hypothetical protein
MRGQSVSHDNIFLTWRGESVLHGYDTGECSPGSGESIRELFLISKNRAKLVDFVPVSGMGLGDEWRGLHRTRG